MSYEEKFDDLEIAGDPDVKEGGNYEALPDGDYQVNGIESFISEAEAGVPTFVPDFSGQMVARFRLRGVDGKQVPFSATKGQMAGIVAAFGGDPSKLPDEESPRFLIAAQKLANAGAKVRNAKVKGGKGWCKQLAGALPSDKDLYQWEIVGFRSHDRSDPIHFVNVERVGKKGTYHEELVYMTLRIVADMWGKATPFKGWELEVPIRNPFAEYMPGTKKPATILGANGGRPIEVNRFLRLRELFAPDFRHTWESDPEKSSLGINEIENPIAVYADAMIKSKRRVVAKIALTSGGYAKIDPMDMSAVGGDPADLDTQQEESKAQHSMLYNLVTLIDSLAGFPVFEDTPKNSNIINLTMTEAGIDFAKSRIVPVWDELDLPLTNGLRMLGELSPEQCEMLMAGLANSFGLKTPAQKAKAGGF